MHHRGNHDLAASHGSFPHVRARQNAPRAGESPEQAKERAAKDFLAMQNSPFFDIWASAGIDEILSGLHERIVFG